LHSCARDTRADVASRAGEQVRMDRVEVGYHRRLAAVAGHAARDVAVEHQSLEALAVRLGHRSDQRRCGPTVEVAAMTAPTVHRTQRRPAANEVGLVSHDLRMDRRERRASPVSALGLTGPISSNLDVPYAVEPSEVPNSLQLECCSQSRNCSAGIGSPMK
jgi:hypothetical protein